jgi:hypothetical protein
MDMSIPFVLWAWTWRWRIGIWIRRHRRRGRIDAIDGIEVGESVAAII